MSKSKHTPGPWAVKHEAEKPDTASYGGHREHFRIVVSDSESEIIGVDSSDGWIDYPGELWPVIKEADAQLMAAAPDLLKALYEIIADASCSAYAAQVAEAAIAKAEGR